MLRYLALLVMPCILVLAAAGCTCKHGQVEYQNEQAGFRFLPPAGWSERARAEDGPALAAKEQVLVQYKRLTAGRPAWLRVSSMAVDASVSPTTCLSHRNLGREWCVDSQPEGFEVNSRPASRVAYSGEWHKMSYLCEIVAIRCGERVYFFTASIPADDSAARDEVRQAIATATWKA